MQRITITAGTGEDASGQPLDAGEVAQAVAGIRGTLARMFGGYTERETVGGWINSAGELVTEPGRQWIALTNKPAREADPLAYEVADYARDALRQASVMLETETVYGRFIESGATVTAAESFNN